MALRNDEPFKVAVAQAAPIFLDREATVEKACGLIAQAGKEGARLVVFPETFIPAYPDWVWSVPPGEKRLLDPLYAELMQNAVVVPGPDTDRLCQAARAADITVAMGINEYDPLSGSGTLYNSVVYIDAQGQILGRHRKLVPTGGERLVWAQGDGSTLEVYQTPFGKLGGLICWENYMPLARYAMYAWGVEIYVAATWDYGEAWLATLRHIAREGRVFVLAACMPMRVSDIPDRYAFKRFYQGSDEWINPGGSAIVNPDGEIVAGPLDKAEGLLYAEIRLSQARGSKRMLDVTGHYNRPDVFQLSVNRSPHPILRTIDDAKK